MRRTRGSWNCLRRVFITNACIGATVFSGSASLRMSPLRTASKSYCVAQAVALVSRQTSR